MKTIIAIAMLLSLTKPVSAQTFAEWFRQKSTQKKYLIQQMAALQVYMGYVSKGYSIAKNGLNTIQNIKHGDFDLHKNYFSSLTSVNPTIKRYIRVADIISLEINIIRQTASVIRYCRQSNQLTISELTYFQNVFDQLLSDCSKSLDKLFAVITDGSRTMKDDERIEAIDKIYDDMVDKQLFCRSFGNTTKGLCIQRMNEQNAILFSKKLNNVK
ncbi:hypothetical protein [Ferruginibacter sp.]|uniref:hypothetical protein n=1 Tax=Ferruginibacter sp. TaxID=1940288 RepID=UPI0026595927|nr:hypothetical protein [Ferruginibacter sp.]